MQRFNSWWTGGGQTTAQTVIAHWIEALDWSLQLVLFIWVVGPTALFLWKTLSDQPGGPRVSKATCHT